MLIAEDLLLLAHDEKTGAPVCALDVLEPRLAAGLILELALRHRVEILRAPRVGPDGHIIHPGRIVVTNPKPTGEAELDRALSFIKKRPRKPSEIIPTLADGLGDRLRADLVRRGVLRTTKGRFLGVIPMNRWPHSEEAMERNLRAHLQGVLLHGVAPAAREAALLSLARDLPLNDQFVAPEHRQAAARRIRQLAANHWAPAAAKVVIDDHNTAVFHAMVSATAHNRR